MQGQKNPILHFRKLAVDPIELNQDSLHQENQPIYSKMIPTNSNWNKFNSATLITLTREAADSSEHAE